LGQGSAFHFNARLGLAMEATALPETLDPPSARWSPVAGVAGVADRSFVGQSQGRLKILLAEDNRINQALAIANLEEWGTKSW